MRKFLWLLVAGGFFWLPRLAMAWDDPGHLVIAAEAYRQLPPEVKAQVFAILQAHPAFTNWEKTYHPNPVLDLPATVFLCSSTWPDEIRNSGSVYDHPQWHFIDYPLRPPDFPLEPDAQPTNNVLYGIAQCERTLGDVHADRELRAVCLSYLIHLVGDMHQPLHCESWYTDVYTNGDRGGNDFYEKPMDTGMRLHGIWDDLLGTTANRRQQWNDAAEIMAKFPQGSLPELAAHTTTRSWSLESRALAIRYGYLDGRLQGGLNADSAPSLPDGYLTTAQAVAQRQAALAGYRLANEIGKYLKWNQELPWLPKNTNTTDLDVPLKISVDVASKYVDETLVVTGKVARVTVSRNVVFIRFEQSFEAVPFTGVIFKEHAGPFGDLQRLVGQNVEINGTVTAYRDRPEMILDATDQLKVEK